MQPNHSDLVAHRREDAPDRPVQWSIDIPNVSRSASNAQRLPSEDSWIEISSQPSSSSLSSAAAEPHNTQLPTQVRHNNRRTRRRRGLPTAASADQLSSLRRNSTAGSSQDEYEESESESDKVLSSSNEELEKVVVRGTARDLAQNNENDSTTGPGGAPSEDLVFTPQPNAFSHPAFSHPPSSQSSRTASGSAPVPDSYFHNCPSATSQTSMTPFDTSPTLTQRSANAPPPRLPQTTSSQPASLDAAQPGHHPSHTFRTDHDAALRASLSTLLSCAAAVRSSSKPPTTASRAGTDCRTTTGTQPTSLRLVPESHFRQSNSTRTSPPESLPSPTSSRRHIVSAKRKAREQSKDRPAKKGSSTTRAGWTAEDTSISPTLVSWMISAGVVLVFSAISFSAGYAWGREVGRLEGAGGLTGIDTSCGQEGLRVGSGGFKRLRWGTASASVRA